jgi:hypothetical protein
LKKLIKWYSPGKAVSGKDKAQLLLVYNAVKEQPPPEDMRWTRRQERELGLVMAREVGSVHNSSIMRDAIAMKTEYFSIKLSTLPPRQLFKVMGAALQDLEDSDLVEEFLQNWRSHAEDTFDVVAEDSDSESYLDKSWSAEDDEEPTDGEESADDEDSFHSFGSGPSSIILSELNDENEEQSDNGNEGSSDTSSDNDPSSIILSELNDENKEQSDDDTNEGSSDSSSDDDLREGPTFAVRDSRAQQAQRRAWQT